MGSRVPDLLKAAGQYAFFQTVSANVFSDVLPFACLSGQTAPQLLQRNEAHVFGCHSYLYPYLRLYLHGYLIPLSSFFPLNPLTPLDTQSGKGDIVHGIALYKAGLAVAGVLGVQRHQP